MTGLQNCELPAVAISACLAGVPCSYKCGHHEIPQLGRLKRACRLVHVCPESQGGLQTPREPAEIQGQRVVARDGRDVTAEFNRGAQAALAAAQEAGCQFALLKEKSPSCGFGRVYDGSFTGTLVPGNGVAAQMLADAGLRIYGESNAEELISLLENMA